MKHFVKKIVILATLLCLSAGPAFAEEYRLAPGDVLEISVWRHEEPQVNEQQVKGIEIRPDGKIEFPLVGEVVAGEATVAALNATLTTTLSDYIKNPKVTINIIKFHTTRVYVLGEVTKPGLYELEKQHNLLDAIGAAGGYTDKAAKKKVFIIRKDQQDEPIKVNLLNLLTKGDTTQNYVLNDGDVVFLSNNGKINLVTDILPFTSVAYQIKHY